MRAFSSAITAAVSTITLLLVSLPAYATFPGKNGRIAFVLGPDIYTMSPDGSNLRQLTFLGEKAAFWESWSPDGKRIVFDVFSPPDFNVAQIWLMNADGSNQHVVLAEDSFNEERPTFSPDGSTIVFNRCRQDIEACALYQVAVTGDKLTAVTGYELGISDLSPGFSPDGHSLIFASIGRAGIIADLYLKNNNSSTLEALTPVPFSARQPNWSPDGSSVVFSTHCCNPQNQEIWTVNVHDHHLKRLTNNGNDYFAGPHDFHPSWSPQGDAIVFERDAPDFSTSAIYVMKSDGSALTKALSVPHSPRPTPGKTVMRFGTQIKGRIRRVEEGGAIPRWGAAAD